MKHALLLPKCNLANYHGMQANNKSLGRQNTASNEAIARILFTEHKLDTSSASKQ